MIHYRRFSLEDVPIFFANSFPKSGTHLLTQVVTGFTKIGPAVNSGFPAIVTFEGNTGRKRTEKEILSDLKQLQAADIAYGHLHAFPKVVEMLCQKGFVSYFILRDPRDVAVSHVHYITEMAPNHVHHRYYTNELQGFDERLTASIEGISKNPNSEATMPDLRSRFEPYLDWLNHPEVLWLRYEDFIHKPRKTVRQILKHAIQRGYRPAIPEDTAVNTLLDCIQPERSPTYRKGTIGGWKEAFSPYHKQLFKETSGDLLIQLGYEQDNHW